MQNLKKILLSIMLIISAAAFAAPQNERDYNQKLYYSCKIWGFYKYFHTEVAKGPTVVKWDDALLDHLAQITPETTTEYYNRLLLEMLSTAGTMAEPTTTMPVLPDSLKPNLDLNWLNDSFLNEVVKQKLATVKDKFRPQQNYYVQGNSGAVNLSFATDTSYASGDLTDLQIRLLALFRYWNCINYFYPYKNIIDQDWDNTLNEMLPVFINCITENDISKAFLMLASHINDTHAKIYNASITEFVGFNYMPLTLKTIENKIVITNSLDSSLDIQRGDILLEVNNRPVEFLRDSISQICSASNSSVLNRVVNNRLLRGTNLSVKLKIEDQDGVSKIITCNRIPESNYIDLLLSLNPQKWSIINVSGKSFGLINMGKLLESDIHQMFTELWNTDALIFDIRNYPNATLWKLVNYLFTENLHIADFTNPDERYPGTISLDHEVLNVTPTSLGYYDKKIVLLFNEDTQSQAEYTVMGLEQHTGAVKIGSQTAGADGTITLIWLPGNTGTYITGKGVFYPDGKPTQRIGIVPDIEVHPTIAGIRAGRDEIMEVALQTVSISSENKPADFELFHNYPNPFNPETNIRFSLKSKTLVSLNIFNIKGELVKNLLKEELPAGMHNYKFNASGLNSGVYFYKIETSTKNQVQKMVLIK